MELCLAQYDLYAPAANFAGAVIRTVKLDPNDWSVPHAAVEAAFSGRTKLVLINSPHKCAGPPRHVLTEKRNYAQCKEMLHDFLSRSLLSDTSSSAFCKRALSLVTRVAASNLSHAWQTCTMHYVLSLASR